MAADVLTLLVQKNQADIEMYKVDLSKGRCKDHPAYCNMVGKIQGLERANATIKDLQQSMREGEDEDE